MTQIFVDGKLSRAAGLEHGKGRKNRIVRTGTLAVTEAADVAAMSAVRTRFGPLAATEVADTAQFVGTPGRTGALAAIEATDTAAFTAASLKSGALAAIEAADTFAGIGTVAAADERVGTLAAIEAADVADLAGETTTVVQPPIFVGGGIVRPPRPFPVEGVGYGILPELEGEAHGVVAQAGRGVATLAVTVLGTGSIGVAGRSAARLTVHAAATVTAGARGNAMGMIAIKGTADARHDDDEMAVVTWLLAA